MESPENFTERYLDSVFCPVGNKEMESVVKSLGNLPSERLKGVIRSNTTVFAFNYKTGVIIAGDKRMIGGFYSIESEGRVKIRTLTKYSAMACAGMCSVISYLEENMENACAKFSRAYLQELSPDGQANYLEHLLTGWWYILLAFDYWAIGSPILAAYDVKNDRPRIFEFDESGFHYEPEVVAGTGCGFAAVKRLIIDYKPYAMEEEAAVALAVRAMFHAGKSSAGVSDVEVVLPSVAVINKDGFKWVAEGKTKGTRDKIISEFGGGHGR